MRGNEPFHVRMKQWLKKMGEALLNFFGGDFPVFILFLVLSFFFWWSNTMGDSYETCMQIPVNVTGYPDDVRVSVPPATQVKVSLGGKGLALWKSRIGYRRHVLEIDSRQFHMHQGHASYSTQGLYDDVAGLLPPSVVVRSIEPDSLTFEYELQTRVSVPVMYGGGFGSQNQFFYESARFVPDSVLISCLQSKSGIPQAVTVNVDGLVLTQDSMEFDVKLIPIDDVLFDRDVVHMTAYASQYTEKRVDVPVTGANFPDSVSLKTFPAKASVSFWVRMSQFEEVTARDFTVVADYNELAGHSGDILQLHILKQPQNVMNVSLLTGTVEILMENNGK